MTTKNALPTKTQIDGLIATCLGAGLNEAAGMLTLASQEISKYAHEDDQPVCTCLEILRDNGFCAVHGEGLEAEGPFSAEDYRADYQERNDLRNMAIGC